jgi:hypothetical protein
VHCQCGVCETSAVKYKDLDPLALARLQHSLPDAELGMADERRMGFYCGVKIIGHYVRRLDNAINFGVLFEVALSTSKRKRLSPLLFGGSPKQLEPVLDPSLAAPPVFLPLRQWGESLALRRICTSTLMPLSPTETRYRTSRSQASRHQLHGALARFSCRILVPSYQRPLSFGLALPSWVGMHQRQT